MYAHHVPAEFPVIELLEQTSCPPSQAQRTAVSVLSAHPLRSSEAIHSAERWTYDSAPYPLLTTPHWGLAKPLSPHYTPYRKVTLQRLTFATFSDFIKFLCYFTHAREFRLLEAVCATSDGLTPVRPPGGHRSLTKVYGTCRHSHRRASISLTHLCMQAFKLNQTLHICSSAEHEQAVVEDMIDSIRKAVFIHSASDLELRHSEQAFSFALLK